MGKKAVCVFHRGHHVPERHDVGGFNGANAGNPADLPALIFISTRLQTDGLARLFFISCDERRRIWLIYAKTSHTTASFSRHQPDQNHIHHVRSPLPQQASLSIE
jgi:hypothetical protein